MKMKVIKRIVLAMLAVVMLLGVLTACGGNSAPTADSINLPIDQNSVEDRAHYLAQVLVMNKKAEEWFVAASRGYDMLDADKNDTELEGMNGDKNLPAVDRGYVNIDAARKALQQEGVAPTNEVKRAFYSTIYNENLNSPDDESNKAFVDKVVKYLATYVDHGNEPGGVMVWVGKFLKVLTNLTGGYYILALFFFAIIIEAALIYFSIKQQKNSIKQARMSPKERAIRKKYAGRNDQATLRKMQEEIQRLYQEEGFNPMGGCLPMLIQMPVLIMLYQIVINPLQYVLGKATAVSTALSTYASTARAAGGLGLKLATEGNAASIEMLSKLPQGYQAGVESFAYYNNGAEWVKTLDFETPNFNLFGLNMGLTPSFTPAENINYLLLLIPVLTFVAYFFSMKINRKWMYQPATDPVTSQQMGCSNNMMDITMPLMSVFIAFITPAAIGIYWIFKCLIGVGKQFIIHKAMPLPTFTEEDYKQAEKEMKAKSKGQRLPTVVQAANGQQYRSLHHIDDEDDLPPRGSVQKPAVYVDDEDEAPVASENAQPENRMAAPLKDDRKNDRKK